MMIKVLEDPGLPLGMQSASRDGGKELDLTWTPRDVHVGKVHQVRVGMTVVVFMCVCVCVCVKNVCTRA
jgi:hypothetical protein